MVNEDKIIEEPLISAYVKEILGKIPPNRVLEVKNGKIEFVQAGGDESKILNKAFNDLVQECAKTKFEIWHLTHKPKT